MRRTLSLLIVFCCISLFAKGQHVLEKSCNSFRASDTIVKQRVEYKDPGRSGANVLWNFSKLKTLDEAYTLAYFQLGDSIVGTEHRTMYFQTFKGDSLLLNGYENVTTWMKNVRPELLLKYPFHYGDSLTSYFQSIGKYCNDLSLDAMGVSTIKADAYGMMMMPDGDTLKNVLRIHTYKRLAEGTGELIRKEFNRLLSLPPVGIDSIEWRLANDSAIIEIETYRWYEKGYRYPIFETIRSVVVKKGIKKDFFDVSFFYPPQEHYYLNEDPINLAILETEENKNLQNQSHDDGKDDNIEKKEILNYNLHPQSRDNTIILEFYLNQDAEVSIYLYDMQGRTLMVFPNKFYPNGYYSEIIELPNWGINQYLLRINVNEKSYTEKLIKR